MPSSGRIFFTKEDKLKEDEKKLEKFFMIDERRKYLEWKKEQDKLEELEKLNK